VIAALHVLWVNINLRQVQQHAQIALPVLLHLGQVVLHLHNALYVLPVGILQEPLLLTVLAVLFAQLARTQHLLVNHLVPNALQANSVL